MEYVAFIIVAAVFARVFAGIVRFLHDCGVFALIKAIFTLAKKGIDRLNAPKDSKTSTQEVEND